MFDNTLLPVLTLAAAGGRPEENAGGKGPEYWPTHGWRVSTPERQGMDSERLAGGEFDIHHAPRERGDVSDIFVDRLAGKAGVRRRCDRQPEGADDE